MVKGDSFVVLEEYGDYHKNPVSETTHKAIILAKRV